MRAYILKLKITIRNKLMHNFISEGETIEYWFKSKSACISFINNYDKILKKTEALNICIKNAFLCVIILKYYKFFSS